ncbi:hypothetical protein D9619_001322 [Psilocybe cf. subviscida]|uniref:Fungal N-terminal domain-containing protein n=1 Tax=Psilocybe cf. subviscida TaxID=2480587 RepID=A0A8H5BGJ0_9AGAR|nr:hypothetical protein D9619_001322 [Psilocybe cf. subviscida]
MAALAGLSAAGSAASIGSFLFDAWGAKSREKKFMELDHLLEETGNNLQQASDAIKENADILEPKVKTEVLEDVTASQLKHEKNIVRQGLAHGGKLSRAERKDYKGSVKENVQISNRHSSNIARTKLLLLEAQSAQDAHGSKPNSLGAVPQIVAIAPQGAPSAHLEPATECGSYAVDSSAKNSESLHFNDDPFVDPTLHGEGPVTVPLEYELQSMSLEGPVQTS